MSAEQKPQAGLDDTPVPVRVKLSPNGAGVEMAQDEADQLRVNLSLSVRTSVLAVGVVLILSGAYYGVTRSPEKSLVFLGAAAASAGAILAAVYAARTMNFQIRQQAAAGAALASRRRQERQMEALRYTARWNEPHMVEARKACREVLLMNGSGVKDITESLSENDRELRALHMLNFLEELAVAIQHDVADEVIMKEMYRDAVVLVWGCMGQWAISYRTLRNQPGALVHLEALYKKWS
jgi:hypothetical protein